MVLRFGSILHYSLIWVGCCCCLSQTAVVSIRTANDKVIETQQSCSSGTCQPGENSETIHDSECGVWLALSTLPGAGIGMFAGKGFEKDEVFMAGDLTVPIVDVETHQGPDLFFLWDEYTWVRWCKGDALNHSIVIFPRSLFTTVLFRIPLSFTWKI